MKKRISIYIDEDVWKDLKDTAWRLHVSASAYLEDLVRKHSGVTISGGYEVPSDDWRSTKESMAVVDLDAENAKLLEKRNYGGKLVITKEELEKGGLITEDGTKSVADRIREKLKKDGIRDDGDVLVEAQAKLERIRGYSKDRQLGKGGKK